MAGFSIEAGAPDGGEKVGHDLDSKKPLLPNDLCLLPELEDFSQSFCDSFLDFDSIDGWFGEAEGDSDLCFGKDMDGLGRNCGKLDGKLGDMIGEKLGKVSLEGKSELDCLIGLENGKNVDDAVVVNGIEQEKKIDGIESSSDVESESEDEDEDEDSESESSSSDSSSGSSDDDEEDEEEEDEEGNSGNEGRHGKKKVRDENAVEEGEIVSSDVDEMVGWSDGEEGPIKSKNELNVSVKFLEFGLHNLELIKL